MRAVAPAPNQDFVKEFAANAEKLRELTNLLANFSHGDPILTEYAISVVRNVCPGADARKLLSDRQQALGLASESKLHLIQAASLQPEPIRWLWHGWLAKGKFHVFAGPPGTGKTTLAMAIAAAITRGDCLPDGSKTCAGNVLIWSGEDDPKDTLCPRLLACGADLERVHFVGNVATGQDELNFDPSIHIDLIEKAAKVINGVSLLIVDPIVSAIAGDSHKNAEVRRGLQPLVEVAERLDCAVLGLSHFSKGTSGRDPVERVTGSIAFAALARIVWSSAKMPDCDQEGGSRILVRTKSNIGPDDGGVRFDLVQTELDGFPEITASKVQWGTLMEGTAFELLQRAETQPEPENEDDQPEVDVWLTEFLAHGPQTAKETFLAAKGEGFSKDQVKRSKQRLGISSGKHTFNGPWSWSLPEGTFAPSEQELPNKNQAHPSHPSLEPQ
ncbi:MAG: hypothetical protein RLZ25_2385 [Pseudomonadota bacterium]|jgi:putative DNA primase/helicase